MSKDFTISETYTLPSKGLIYDIKVSPEIQLRSMTTEEEMRRLSPSDRPYKVLCDIIDDCIVGNKPAISSYDMCLGDYQYLLHKLRVVTYGEQYNMDTVCPYCGADNRLIVDLDKLGVSEYDESLEKYFNFTLPKSKKKIGIRLQTPRSMDEIAIRQKDDRKKHPEIEVDTSILYTLEYIIDTVDSEHLDKLKLNQIIRKLPMADTNYILQSAHKLNSKIGLNTVLNVECKGCGVDYSTSFRITGEFFGPSID